MKKSDDDNKMSELIELFKIYQKENYSDEMEKLIKFMEDFEDKLNMDNIERYKKAYNADRIDKCVEILIDIGMSDSNHFRKKFILSNTLISPFSQKFNETELNKNMKIYCTLISKAKDYNFDKEYVQVIKEMYFYTKLFYENNKANTERLEKNDFLNILYQNNYV